MRGISSRVSGSRLGTHCIPDIKVPEDRRKRIRGSEASGACYRAHLAMRRPFPESIDSSSPRCWASLSIRSASLLSSLARSEGAALRPQVVLNAAARDAAYQPCTRSLL